MNVELLTKEDLQEFRTQLLNDFKRLFHLPAQPPQKPWLKTAEVKKLLQVSTNTLHSLRSKGMLHPSKVGGILFYSWEEIDALLTSEIRKQG